MKKCLVSVFVAAALLCGTAVTAAGAETGAIEIKRIPGVYNGFLDMEGNKTSGYIQNSSGNQIKQAANGPYFIEGKAIVATDGKYGRIDTTGKLVDPVGSDISLGMMFSEGLLATSDPHMRPIKYGYVDSNFDLVIPYQFDSAKEFHEGLAAVSSRTDSGVKWGFIDRSSSLVVPYQYDRVGDFSEGLAAVITSVPVPKQPCNCGLPLNGDHDYDCPSLSLPYADMLGFIDKRGEVVIPPEYFGGMNGVSPLDYARFSEGLASVVKNNKVCYIDKTGKTILTLSDYSLGYPFSEGLAMVVSREGKCGYIDKSGKLVIPFRSGAVGSFQNGYALVSNDKPWPATKYGYINQSGEVVVPIEYDYASYFNEGYALAQKGENWDQWYILRANVNEPQPTSSTPSPWAAADVARASSLKLVPDTLDGAYTQAATRAEFCALAVTLYETTTGKAVAERKAFTDTKDVNVEKAAAIGVVTGTNAEGTIFDPDARLTREQAATMLSRLAAAIGKPLPEQTATFADNAAVSSWAAAQVGQMQAAGIMGGVGDNKFNPTGHYTREQSIVTILRLYDAVK